ncbi:MAG TPA: GTPase ObgE [Armatimonadota bacterium]|nr:GTPase ObgE [Armatimonadota bacterium]
MFVDEVKIHAKAGTGGNGASTFRREKYVPRGGPDGGDGGNGGSIYLVADTDVATLLDFRYKHIFKAESGSHGQRSNKHGKQAPDLILKVPVGTLIRDGSGTKLGDLTRPGQRLLLASGGRGGRGNARFATATNQAPRFAENGEPGEEREVDLELKIMADVGLVGLPNAGKSSLLSRISAAHPKIADYPFTTLVPELGVVSLGDHESCVFADMPGLIEGAHEGLGLGQQFLRHIERTRMLVHVVDVTGGDSEDPMQNFRIIMRELETHNPELARLPMLIALNKIDIETPERTRETQDELSGTGREVFPISAATGAGTERLLHRVRELLPRPSSIMDSVVGSPVGESLESKNPEDERELIEGPRSRRLSRKWSIQRDPDGAWRVTGEGLERLVAMTNVDNESAIERLHRILDRAGVLDALRTAGAADNDLVRIRDTEFVYVEEERVYSTRRRRSRTAPA